jgi:hypothetical protein
MKRPANKKAPEPPKKKAVRLPAKPKVIVIRPSRAVTSELGAAIALPYRTKSNSKVFDVYDLAVAALRKCQPNDKVSEARYGLAYLELTKLGLAAPLRRRFRG